jgi:GDP/UDP-N,N'-diacetylbacillosamine 2-epimerase (hydrolysing)
MTTRRKICVVTGTRAEFGPLTPLIKRIKNDADLELQLLVTGMHLSPEFGHTIDSITNQFEVTKKIEILLSSDSPVGVNKSMGLAQISFAEAFDELKPDIVVILGDRFEIFSVAATAMMMNIPIAHLSGGELTMGAIDDSIRHSITKMSHLHFVATEEYRKRVIQLGENPDRVFNFGEAGLDNITDLKLLSKQDFEESINHKLKEKTLLITYHPTTLDSKPQVISDFDNILRSLDKLENTLLIFTKANSDAGGRVINQMIDQFVGENSEKAIVFTSLGQLRYLSALQYVDAVVGNTSSGIVEAPSFKIGSINIGSRQKGRIQSSSVINCSTDSEELQKAFNTLYSISFQEQLKNVENPYGQGNSSKRTLDVLKNINLEGIIKKEFWDLQSSNPITE